MNATFRPALKSLILGAVLLLCGLVMLAVSAAHWVGFELSAVNDRSAWFTGLLGVAGVGLGTLLTSISLMTRFTIAGETIAIRRPFALSKFGIGEIIRIVWKLGQPRFELSAASTQLDLNLFSNDDRLAIIRVMRRLVPESSHVNWGEFCHRSALPLRDGGSRWLMSLPASARFLQTRKRWDNIFVYLLLWSVVSAMALSIYLPISQVLALPLLVCAFWPLIRFATPQDGYWQLRMFGTVETRELAVAWLLVPATMVLLTRLEWGSFKGPTMVTIAILISVAVFARLLIVVIRMDKRRAQCDQVEMMESARLWEAGEQTLAK